MRQADESARAHQVEPVRILPVPLTGEIAVLFCGPLAGLLVHRQQGRPIACPGEGSCPTATHRGRTLYYGYAPVRAWRPQRGDWAAVVLEATEHLEELLRGRTLRGELWLLARATDRKRTGPVGGVYLETRPEAEVPPPFDVRPALARLYHTTELALGVANPLPARVVIPPAQLAPPPGADRFGLADPPRPTPAHADSLRRIAPHGMAAAAGLRPERNGHEKR